MGGTLYSAGEGMQMHADRLPDANYSLIEYAGAANIVRLTRCNTVLQQWKCRPDRGATVTARQICRHGGVVN